jgi:hypothetical protein
VPPLAVTDADPSQLFPQEALVALVLTVKGPGSVIVTVEVRVHPFWSLTTRVYAPAHSPVAVAED